MAKETKERLGIVAIVLGASEFPYGGPRITANEAFARSADGFMRYLRRESGLNLPYDNVLNLFNESSSVFDQDQKITDFLTAAKDAKDIIIYYVGHGGFLSDRDYFLALRSTRQQKEHLTGLQIKGLAESLQPLTAGKRLYLILDCCFAGEAVREFQSAELSTVVEKKTFDNLPESGTSLLVAASKDEPAIAPADKPFTMFSKSFLEVLQTGIPEKPQVLSLLDVGVQTRRLIEGKYGLSAVRPEIHAPKQGGGLVSTVPLFPNPIGRQQIPTFSPGLPLTVEAAKEILHAAPPEQVKKLRELFSAYMLQSIAFYKIYNVDLGQFLTQQRKTFDDSVVIERQSVNSMFEEAEKAMAGAIDPAQDYHARSMVFESAMKIIRQKLPTKEQCLTMMVEVQRELLVPFLLNLYFSRDADYVKEDAREVIVQCVDQLSLGKELIAIPQHEILGSFPGNPQFSAAAHLARQILGTEFDEWYRNLRGQSFEEEVQTYEQREAEQRRAEEERRQTLIDRALDEFRPEVGSLGPTLKPKQAAMLIDKLRLIISELEKDTESDDLLPSVHRAKYLLKRYNPDAAYRIHKAEVLAEESRQYGNPSRRATIDNTTKELKLVIEILEIDLAGSNSGQRI